MLTTIAALTMMLGNQASEENRLKRIILPPGDKVAALSQKEAADKCTETLEGKEKLSGLDLLFGSGACAKAARLVDASFLFNIGVIRGGADVSLLIPATKADSKAQYDLTVALYYGAGNVGSDEVIRIPAYRNRLVGLIESWKPNYSQTYQPGWTVTTYVPPEEYDGLIAEAKRDTISEINRVAVLVSDHEYYRLHSEYVALIDRVGRQEKQDPADIAKIEALQSAKMRRAAALGDASALSASSTKPASTSEESKHHPKPALAEAAQTVDRPNDPVVKRCARDARRHAVADGGEVLRAVVVEEPVIGIVYRADLSDDSGGTTRFWCSERFTGSQPLASGLPEDLAPLPNTAAKPHYGHFVPSTHPA